MSLSDFKIFAFADEADSAISGQIAAMQKHGLAGLEIRNVDGTNVADISVEKAREVRKQLEDVGLSADWFTSERGDSVDHGYSISFGCSTDGVYAIDGVCVYGICAVIFPMRGNDYHIAQGVG